MAVMKKLTRKSVLLACVTSSLVLAAPMGVFIWSPPELPPLPGPVERLLPQGEPERPHTINSRLEQFGESARDRLAGHFDRVGLTYPPRGITLLGLKEEKRLELYAEASDGQSVYLTSFPFRAWTGTLGPKLREGDMQIPEGIYGAEYLNPNSIAHVSLKVGYPNAFERDRGLEDGRTNLGGDIMIHGLSWGSAGCVVLGNTHMEEVFTLAADVGLQNVQVLLSPADLRTKNSPVPDDAPDWTASVYEQLRDAMQALPLPETLVAED